ncbi:MAG: glycosyltransferase family A protein [Sarcina sp.]
MKIDILVASMNSNNSLVDEMNISSGAVIINQSDFNDVEKIDKNGEEIKIISNDNRGVGRSRNLAIMNSKADICLIADEDMIYVDDYSEIVKSAFQKYKDADMILFNIESLNPERPCYEEKFEHKVNQFNFMKYGACRVAVKRKRLLESNIFFSLMFGGGAKYGSGEDSLFLNDCLKNGFKIYAVPTKIADVKQDDSTWFNGYTDKYYFDKGALFGAMGKRKSVFLIPIMALKAYRSYKGSKSIGNVINLMYKGRKEILIGGV